MSDHLYALPGSSIYHKVVAIGDRLWIGCTWIAVNDLMSTRLAEGVHSEPDKYGHRRCRRCFR